MNLYVQVLRLLEDVGLPELVIQLASLAITETVCDAHSQVRVCVLLLLWQQINM